MKRGFSLGIGLVSFFVAGAAFAQQPGYRGQPMPYRPPVQPSAFRPGGVPVQQPRVQYGPAYNPQYGNRPSIQPPAGRPVNVSPYRLPAPINGSRWTTPFARQNAANAHFYINGFLNSYPRFAPIIQTHATNYYQTNYRLYVQRVNTFYAYRPPSAFRYYSIGASVEVVSQFNITVYFGYPMVLWMCVPQPPADFFQAYYPPGHPEYGVQPFSNADAIFPTQALLEMGIEVSGMPMDKQFQFRRSFSAMVDMLRTQIGMSLGRPVALDPQTVVISHYGYYQNPRGSGLAVDGFVQLPGVHAPIRPFRAWLDLADSARTLTVMPASPTLTQIESDTIQEIDHRIAVMSNPPPVQGGPQPSPLQPNGQPQGQPFDPGQYLPPYNQGTQPGGQPPVPYNPNQQPPVQQPPVQQPGGQPQAPYNPNQQPPVQQPGGQPQAPYNPNQQPPVQQPGGQPQAPYDPNQQPQPGQYVPPPVTAPTQPQPGGQPPVQQPQPPVQQPGGQPQAPTSPYGQPSQQPYNPQTPGYTPAPPTYDGQQPQPGGQQPAPVTQPPTGNQPPPLPQPPKRDDQA